MNDDSLKEAIFLSFFRRNVQSGKEEDIAFTICSIANCYKKMGKGV
jgi:hypothetical protein